MLYTIAEMNTTSGKRQADAARREIARIKRDLQALGPMHPGSVSRQYQVCGKPGCKCMDADNPQKHGPYHKLAYVHRGRPVCRFVRAECVEALGARLEAYKKFRSLADRWVELSIRQGGDDFFPSQGSNAQAAKTRPPKAKKAAGR
jgi:hypothetical protein